MRASVREASKKSKLGLGAAESLMDDFFWPRWRFEVGVFDLISVGRGQGIDETVERGKVATVRALDGLLDAVIARDQDGVGSAHVGEAHGGVGFPPPLGEPLSKSLSAGKHRRERCRILSAGDTCEVTEKEGEIDLLGAEQVETFLNERDGRLRWETEFGAEAGDVLAPESLRISGENCLGNPGRFAMILRQ